MIWLYMRIATALFPKSLQHAKKGSTRPLLIIGVSSRKQGCSTASPSSCSQGIVRAKCKQPVAQAKEAYHELFQLQALSANAHAGTSETPWQRARHPNFLATLEPDC